MTSYSFEYDQWYFGDNWYKELFHLHADYVYRPTDYEQLYFGIVFADTEKFSEWLKK